MIGLPKQKCVIRHRHGDDRKRQALITASDIEGPINVASGRPIAVRTVIETVAGLLGGQDLVDLGALARPADDPPCVYADTTRLRALGFSARFDLPAGLRDTVSACSDY